MTAADAAETLGLRALAVVLGDARLTGAFLVQTGAAPESVRARAEDRDFLAGVLQFALADERRAATICGALEIEPAALHRALAVLTGEGSGGPASA